MKTESSDAELFVIEERAHSRGYWLPLPDAYTTVEEGQRVLVAKRKAGGFRYKRLVRYRPAEEIIIFQCEECGRSERANSLPLKWTQTGKSKFPNAVDGLAAYCPVHSK